MNCNRTNEICQIIAIQGMKWGKKRQRKAGLSNTKIRYLNKPMSPDNHYISLGSLEK